MSMTVSIYEYVHILVKFIFMLMFILQVYGYVHVINRNNFPQFIQKIKDSMVCVSDRTDSIVESLQLVDAFVYFLVKTICCVLSLKETRWLLQATSRVAILFYQYSLVDYVKTVEVT